MSTLKHYSIVPPGGWRYVQPDTAVRFESDTLEDLVRQVTRHREYKGLNVDHVQLDIERQLCWGLSDEWCRAEPGEVHKPVRDLTQELTTQMAASLGKAVVAFLGSGGKFNEKPEAQRRAAICRGCPFNKSAKACSCSAVYKLVEAMVPATRQEPGVSVCMACGCSLQAKINLPLEVVKASLSPEVVVPPWCWQADPTPP